MSYEQLREEVWKANVDLVASGLVVLTWGNASGVDRRAGVMAIKPSGVAYDRLKPEHIVVVSLDTGEVVDGSGRPSSDTPTHLHLLRSFPALGGIVHTHSTYGTCFAQAGRDIPCLGTTHADNFYGAIPCTREMTAAEIETDYELNTGRVMVECFERRKLDAIQVPGILVASHAPFAWGTTPAKAVENAIVLEFTAQMALHTAALNPTSRRSPKSCSTNISSASTAPVRTTGRPTTGNSENKLAVGQRSEGAQKKKFAKSNHPPLCCV